MEQSGQAAAASADHEQIRACGLFDERFAHVVVPDQLDLELDRRELLWFGLERVDELSALNRFHTVDAGDESRMAHTGGGHTNGGQSGLPARCVLESKPDRCRRQMQAIHTTTILPEGAADRRRGSSGQRREGTEQGRHGDAHRSPGRPATLPEPLLPSTRSSAPWSCRSSADAGA